MEGGWEVEKIVCLEYGGMNAKGGRTRLLQVLRVSRKVEIGSGKRRPIRAGLVGRNDLHNYNTKAC